MDGFLKDTYDRLVDQVKLDYKRYLYPKFELSRLTGIIGPRGVGKTTLMLQYIKEHLFQDDSAFYFSADFIYFKNVTLVEFVNELYQNEGYRIFFIDEIHKYKNWNQELKNIYDAFPDVKVIFSGSSMLDIIKGSYDLSRRARIFKLQGMSFREYLSFKSNEEYSLVDYKKLIAKPKEFRAIGSTPKLKGHFKNYLEKGYYPFVFEESHTYYERVLRTVDKIIFEDIANYYNLKTPNLHIFKKILSFLASIPPGEINTHNIAKNIQVADQTVDNFLRILQEVGLVHLLYPYEGGNQLLRKPQKIFLHNTTLLYALQQYVGTKMSVGNLRELYFMQALRDSSIDVYYSKQADYRTQDVLFEIGGKNKKQKQLKNTELRPILVKADIILPETNIIPLSYFGFLY